MAEIETTRPDIRALRGVHLYHFGMSNCSQRVRLALEEKGVNWASHEIDLRKNAHLTPDFKALNPAGLVPVLVHDGRTITESNDIIEYVDSAFPGPKLGPTNEADVVFLAETLVRSSQIQGALKLVSHEFLFKPTRRMSPAELDAFEQSADPALAQFMRDLNSRIGFGESRIRSAVADFVQTFDDLDARLHHQRWLSGNSFGLADISWIVNIHRLAAMVYPLGRHPQLADWYQRMKARPSYLRAIDRFQPLSATLFFAAYSAIRKIRGTSIDRYVDRKACIPKRDHAQ